VILPPPALAKGTPALDAADAALERSENVMHRAIAAAAAAKPAANRALQAIIDAEDAGVILPPPAHLRNRTRKQSAVLEQLMAKMRVDAAREASANGKTIYYNNNNNDDRFPSLPFITGRYNVRRAQAARAKEAANLEGRRKQEFYDRLSERFQIPKMNWKTYEGEHGSSLYNEYKYGGALSKTMSALRKSQKTRKGRKAHKAHKAHKTRRH
jgi:hypothetical protein